MERETRSKMQERDTGEDREDEGEKIQEREREREREREAHSWTLTTTAAHHLCINVCLHCPPQLQFHLIVITYAHLSVP